MHHRIKIQQPYLIHILEGKKTFEIRKNDRDYQVGDILQFLPLGNDDYDCYGYTNDSELPLFEITYTSQYEQKDGYIVFGIKESARK